MEEKERKKLTKALTTIARALLDLGWTADQVLRALRTLFPDLPEEIFGQPSSGRLEPDVDP